MGIAGAAVQKDLNEAIWLVKSGERIIGPFTSEEVVQRLRSKEIVVIDEVVAPLSRWRYIRDEPAFATVVDEIRRGLMSAREDTEIQGHTNTMTQTLTATEATWAQDNPEKAALLGAAGFAPGEIKDAEFTESQASGAKPATAQPVKRFGVSKDQGMESRLSRFAVLVWAVALTGLVASVYLFLKSRSQREPEVAPVDNFAAVVAEADSSYRQGEFEEALRNYRQANGIRPNQPEVIVRLAPLLIQYEGGTVAAKRMIQDTVQRFSSSMDAGVRGQMETAAGLASILSDELADADQRFRTAISTAPSSMPAVFNLGMTAYLRKNWDDSFRRFSGAGGEPAALLMAARAALAGDKDRRAAMRKDADASISRLLARHYDYRLEALVIGAFLDLDSGYKRAALNRVRAAIETDPQMTDDHWHDPLLYREPLGWKYLMPFCRKINEELKAVAARALFAICLEKAGSREQAHKVIDTALTANADDSNLRAVKAFLLWNADRDEEARAVLRLSGRSGPAKLGVIVRGRICTKQQNYACAEQAWRELSTGSTPSLAALTGLAQIRQAQGDVAQAQEFIERAAAMSPRYKPALLLKEGSAQ